MAAEEDQYKPKDAIKEGMISGAVLGGAGLLLVCMENALTKQNVGAWGFLTRGGSKFAMITAMGATFGFTQAAAANLREKNDHYNPMIGGAFAGPFLGLRFGTIAPMLGFGAGTAVVMGCASFTGGLVGAKKDRSVDEFERKQQLRKNRRRPIEETIEELGERRGIKAPGYDERRAVRMKEKYGIDLPIKS